MRTVGLWDLLSFSNKRQLQASLNQSRQSSCHSLLLLQLTGTSNYVRRTSICLLWVLTAAAAAAAAAEPRIFLLIIWLLAGFKHDAFGILRKHDPRTKL